MVDEAVGALLQHRLSVKALVVQVTLVLVGGGPRLGLARVSELPHGCQVMSGHVSQKHMSGGKEV